MFMMTVYALYTVVVQYSGFVDKYVLYKKKIFGTHT